MTTAAFTSRAGLFKESCNRCRPVKLRSQCVQRTRVVFRTASKEGASTSSMTPWGFGFQVNERFLQWDDAATSQLLKLHLSQKLQVTLPEVEERLEQLSKLVPDITAKLPRMRADILLALTQDAAATTTHLLGLKELMPGVNISSLVARWPYIIMDFTLEELKARMQEMRQQLPGVRVEALIDLEPQILKVDLNLVLANIRRIMPGHDPVRILVAQPQMVLDMQQAGMGSALDVEGFTPSSGGSQQTQEDSRA